MSDVVRKRLLLAMTVSVIALAVASWGSRAPAQEVAADPAAGGETSVGDEGIDPGALPDDAAIGDPVDEGEVTVDDGWVDDGEVTVDDGWVDDGEVTVDDGWVDDGEVTIDDGWVDEGVITIDDGWVDDGSVFEGEVDTPPTGEGWVEDPATSGPGEVIAEKPGVFDPESVEIAPEVMTFNEEVMMQSGLPEVQRDLAAGAPSAAAGAALPAAQDRNAAGEGCSTAGKDEVCVAP